MSLQEDLDAKLQEPPAKYEKLKTLFRHIAFLELGNEQKEELSMKIHEDTKGDRLYWIEIALSSIIATFGLLQNSVAVIIGAMVIAPLLRPIKGISLGIASGAAHSFWRAVKLLLKSVLVAIGISYVVSLIVPLRIETSEIIARTVPNLLDLFVAIASGTIALLALNFKRLSESVAGVAMAAALLPPLAVVGIELSLGNYALSFGSFLLFATNILAIVLVGILIFFFYGFSPHQEASQRRMIQKTGVIIALTLVISFPLFSSLSQIASKITLKQTAQSFLQEELLKNDVNMRLTKLDVVSLKNNEAHLVGEMQIPEGVSFFKETYTNIQTKLGDHLKKDIKLDLEILRTASITSKEIEEQKNIIPVNMEIARKLKSILAEVEGVTLISADVTASEKKWLVKVIYSTPAGIEFAEPQQLDLEKMLGTDFPQESLSFLWVQLSEFEEPPAPKEKDQREIFHEKLVIQWQEFLKKQMPKGSRVEDLKITWSMNDLPELKAKTIDATGDTLTKSEKPKFDEARIKDFQVKFDLYLDQEDADKIGDIRGNLQAFASDEFGQPVEIEIRTFIYQRDVIPSLEG